MSLGARYVHTNLIAHDWRRLADFYQMILDGLSLSGDIEVRAKDKRGNSLMCDFEWCPKSGNLVMTADDYL